MKLSPDDFPLSTFRGWIISARQAEMLAVGDEEFAADLIERLNRDAEANAMLDRLGAP